MNRFSFYLFPKTIRLLNSCRALDGVIGKLAELFINHEIHASAELMKPAMVQKSEALSVAAGRRCRGWPRQDL